VCASDDTALHKVHPTCYGVGLAGPKHLIESGFESEEIQLIKEQLGSADVFVDVGANIGLSNCLAASMNGG
jgi:hypothetical protein